MRVAPEICVPFGPVSTEREEVSDDSRLRCWTLSVRVVPSAVVERDPVVVVAPWLVAVDCVRVTPAGAAVGDVDAL